VRAVLWKIWSAGQIGDGSGGEDDPATELYSISNSYEF
jgi:hypothetical protein